MSEVHPLTQEARATSPWRKYHKRRGAGGGIYEQMIGKVAANHHGKLGVIVAYHHDRNIWTGLGFDRTPWGSKNPEIVAESIDAYIASSFIAK